MDAIEPKTSQSAVECSTTELHSHRNCQPANYKQCCQLTNFPVGRHLSNLLHFYSVLAHILHA